MNRPAHILAAAALAGLAACQEQQSVANQFERTSNEIANTADTIEAATENNVRAAENALDQQTREWENRTLEVNVSVANRQ
jgi:hypothetical protein